MLIFRGSVRHLLWARESARLVPAPPFAAALPWARAPGLATGAALRPPALSLGDCSPLMRLTAGVLVMRSSAARFSTSSTLGSEVPRKLKLVPAGCTSVADFKDPREDVFFVDKSPYIRILESTAKVVALLRPQRWGKSVFLDILANYYDVSNANQPLIRIQGGDTPLAHSFSILRFDLASAARSVPAAATVDEMKAATKAALDAEIRASVESFVERYSAFEVNITADDSHVLLPRIARWAQRRGAPLYVLVDEYDALLRTLAITSGDRAVDVLAGRQGPLREFFGRFKSLHDSGLLPRIFLTGISPVGLDTMTTGFNIVTNVSHDAPFNGTIGFTHADVEEALLQCLGLPKQSEQQQLVIEMLRRWGNGYLFSAGLGELDGMFQSVMVVQALTQLRLLPGQLTADAVRAFTSAWTPSGPIGVEPEKQLLDFFTRSGSMLTLLPKLVAGSLIAAPSPLSSLAVEQQVDSAAPAADIASAERSCSLLAAVDAVRLETSPALLRPVEASLARTLYFEGLLTHAPQAAAALRVSNESMKQRFIDRFTAHLSEDHRLHAAALAFVEKGETRKMASLLVSLCRPGLLGQSIEGWYELHCSQRLQLLLSAVASDTGVDWTCELPVLRVFQDGHAMNGFVDLLGRSRNGRRVIIIEAKQVNVVKDLAIFEAELADARSQSFKSGDNKIYNETIMSCAKRLTRMPKAMLMGLAFRSSSIKVHKLGQLCIRDVIVGAADQATSYGRGVRHDYPGINVDAYVIVAVGPLRWHIEKVPVPFEV